MAKKRKGRRGKGEGSIEHLPSGKWRAVLPGRGKKGKSKTHPTYDAARDWLRDNVGKPVAASGTVGDWLTTWLEIHKGRSAPKTYVGDRFYVQRHIRPKWAAVKLRDLSALSIQTWLGELKAAGVSNAERHRIGKTLRNALNTAVTFGQLPASPMARIKLPQPDYAEASALTAADAVAVVGAAERLGHGAMFRLWLDAGLQPAELTGLRWEDYDPAAGTVRVRRSVCSVTGDTKDVKVKGRKRTIPLAPSTRAALDRVRKAAGVMFPAPEGGHWWPGNFGDHVFGPVVAAAGVTATPYTMRHTMASLLLQRWVSLKVVSERLGHARVTTTLAWYAHCLPGMQEAAAAEMERLLNPSAHQVPTKPGDSTTPAET